MSWSAPVVPLADPAGGPDLIEVFRSAIGVQTLIDWLPGEPARILDLSRDSQSLLEAMLTTGHEVVQADCLELDWLRDGSIDAVVAEGGALSEALAAEVTVEALHRVLRPGGQLLLAVDSLVAGLGRLADAGKWAELADVPSADVVLIPEAGGHVSRCFWPEELHGMLVAAGFAVEWIRPRSVLAEDTVLRALQQDPTQLDALVATELALEAQRQGESIGRRLIASARRP